MIARGLVPMIPSQDLDRASFKIQGRNPENLRDFIEILGYVRAFRLLILRYFKLMMLMASLNSD
jgi:hypothetical protein